MTLKNMAAISGIADLAPTRNPDGLHPLAMTAELARLAAADAGLEPGQIDGLLLTVPVATHSMFWPSYVADNLGLKLKYFDSVELGGASAAGMVWRAAAAIQAGLCEHVLCVTTEVLNLDAFLRVESLLPDTDPQFELPYGASPPNAGYAMIARRHMYEFGTTPEQLAKVAVDQRKNALATPQALFNKAPLTVEEVLASKLIYEPIHLLEIVSPCSGGSAVVVSRKSLAKGGRHPVSLLGAGEAGSHMSITARRDITTSWAKESAQRAFAMAGMKPRQVSFAQIYDCYTIAVLMFIEDLGFCAKGQGGAFVAEHDLSYSGDFPCNTNGGQLSYGQAGTAGGMIHVTEAVRQLRGEAGERQVRNASCGVVHGNGGVMSDEVTLVLAA
jgi:acetyl-CoA C-acetyltransferase